MTNTSLAHPATRTLRWLAPLLVLAAWPAGRLTAQDFTPPETAGQASDADAKFKIGLYGFGGRFGWDFEEDAGGIMSLVLDLGNLGSEQLRLRPSVEIGFADDVDTYVVNAEVLYRFTPDTEKAIPYVGAGIALAGRDDCSTVPGCPEGWLQFMLGFELAYRSTFNWLLEYHAEDALRRHRLFVGLTTRRGG